MNFLKVIMIVAAIFYSRITYCQRYATVDLVKAKAEFEKEAMFFYENNWKAFREEAFKQKIISGYNMYRSKPDSTGYFDIILITEYKNAEAQAKAEEKFRPIMKKISPDGPKYLNTIKREEFLKYVAGSEGFMTFGKR